MTTEYVALDAIRTMTGYTAGHIYKLAHDHNWRRVKEGVKVRYHIRDVLESVSANKSVSDV